MSVILTSAIAEDGPNAAVGAIAWGLDIESVTATDDWDGRDQAGEARSLTARGSWITVAVGWRSG